MTASYRGIVLSDLDGTFLDDAYQPVLSAHEFAAVLARWRVIWVTSRTVLEIQSLQRSLRHHDDAIGENGGVCLTYSADVAARLGRSHQVGKARVSVLADDARATRDLVNSAFGSVGRSVLTFQDLAPTTLAKRARYGVQDAVRAQHRVSSVVLVDLDLADVATRDALEWLRAHGCSVASGGQWTTVLRGADKGQAASRWLQAIDNRLPVIAIGDGANDESLLGIADMAFVIRGSSGAHHPALAAVAKAHALEVQGPAGWQEMLDIIESQFEGARQ